MNKIITSKGVMDIEIAADAKMNADGEHYIICPICTPLRKKEHQKDPLLAINIKKDPMPWRCNHCGEKGYVLTEEYLKKAKFKPIISKFDFIELSDPMVQWFWTLRKISIATLGHSG
jgi:hypothetical protein